LRRERVGKSQNRENRKEERAAVHGSGKDNGGRWPHNREL
jgi:hypothetical protein